MQEVAALLLCKLGGMAGSADDIKAVITAAGGEPNDDQIAALVGDVDGKDVNELLSAGMEKLKDVPMGGGAFSFVLMNSYCSYFYCDNITHINFATHIIC